MDCRPMGRYGLRQLGGFNFQWAWASGHAAGTAV